MDVLLTDYIISPTEHMISYFTGRGWVLPPNILVIPNVLPDVTAEARPSGPRAVWRLAFFSRSASSLLCSLAHSFTVYPILCPFMYHDIMNVSVYVTKRYVSW